jgi:acyl phosphate:glycerol-3-phosphate acyltransferase
MTPSQQVTTLVPAAYLVGSIPFGLMVGKLKGVDPRTAGSGNIGASNVGRLLGRKFFVMVFLLDLLKGLLPMLLAGRVLQGTGQEARTYFVWLLVGFAAIVGHMFSVFLGLKGGKGVATSSGVLLGLFPYFTIPGSLALLAWVVVLRATRYISVASMVAAILFPIAYVMIALVSGWPVFREQLPLLGFAVLVAAMIVYKHRSNIARLRAGTEPRYDAPRPAAAGDEAADAPRPASAA